MEHHSFNVDKLDLSFSHGLRALPFKSSFKQKMRIVAKCLSDFLTRAEPRGLGLVKRGAKEFSVHVSLCGNDKIKSLNRDYRGKDKVTDVLSFPMNEDLRGEKEPLFAMCELGDIIICSPVMQKQAVEFSISNEEEFFHLVVHGFLHLCGYDHEISEEEEKIMEKLEKQLISNISKGLK